MRHSLGGFTVVIGTLLAAGPASAQSPPPPLVTSTDWEPWYQSLLASRLAECPEQRAQTLYFSQAGDDQTGNGSAAQPWKTLSKAKSVLDGHPAGNLSLLFRRGDTWREPVGLLSTAPGITLGDYGAGEKPTFTAFSLIQPASAWLPTPGAPNVYQRPEFPEVTWANEDSDLDHPYRASASIEDVGAHEGSWFWTSQGPGAGTLYIHPRHGPGGGATDPRVDGKSYELVRTSAFGVRVVGNRTRVQNIRAVGWGMRPSGGTQQEHGIDCRVEGDARAVFVGCESYYGATHCMTHWSVHGGTATFVGCRAGLTSFGANEEIFNTYSIHGDNQTIFESCEAAYGSLPGYRRLTTRSASAAYGHTDGPPYCLGLTVFHRCTVRDTPNGCAGPAIVSDIPPAASLAAVRCFIVGERFEGGDGTGISLQLGIPGVARVNGRYLNVRPQYSVSECLAGWASGGWVINCTLEADCSAQAPYFSLYNSHGAPSSPRFWYCDFRFATYPGQHVLLDHSFSSPTASLRNSVLIATGGGDVDPNFGGGAEVGNAYFGAAPSALAGDPFARILTAPTPIGARPACGSPLACAATQLPRGLVLAFDEDSRAATPRDTIGPVQAFPCGNCDGSASAPLLTFADFTCFLQKFGAGDPQANCDGSTAQPVLNVLDFTCFLQRFAAGCP